MANMDSFTSFNGSTVTRSLLNVRQGSPSRGAPVRMKAQPGTRLRVLGSGKGEDVSGNLVWYMGENNTFFWSGGCTDLIDETLTLSPQTNIATANGLVVSRRSDNTILPLGEADMERVFGKFSYSEAPKGAIAIEPAWLKANLVQFAIPALAALGFAKVTVHRKAQSAFERVFQAIEANGLTGKILSYSGTFSPRHKGHNPARGLSSHSWAVAIDINVAWNGYGHMPAALGAIGSVRELVPLFEAEGFAWGGYFSHPYEDGMHFELARRDL